jgi:hypothetical protein
MPPAQEQPLMWKIMLGDLAYRSLIAGSFLTLLLSLRRPDLQDHPRLAGLHCKKMRLVTGAAFFFVARGIALRWTSACQDAAEMLTAGSSRARLG